MTQYCLSLYSQMLQEIQKVNQIDACLQRKTELCFQISYRYWNQVREKLCSHQFQTDDAEIQFFKRTKPLFTSEMEYATLIYHRVLFAPNDSPATIQFWQREYLRLQNFVATQKPFLTCYFSQTCKWTSFYFLRRNYVPYAVAESGVYEGGQNISANGDRLTAMFLALKRLKRHAAMKIAQLK